MIKPPLFSDEVKRFKRWASTRPNAIRTGEWECDYEQWPALHASAIGLLESATYETLNVVIVADFLYAIARDNETEYLARKVGKCEPTLLQLAAASVSSSEDDAKWQLAEQLGAIAEHKSEAETILLRLVDDDNEYVRRRALLALGMLGSRHAEALSIRAWNSGLEYQRIVALWVLKAIDSEKLTEYVSMAKADGRKYLMQNVQDVEDA